MACRTTRNALLAALAGLLFLLCSVVALPEAAASAGHVLDEPAMSLIDTRLDGTRSPAPSLISLISELLSTATSAVDNALASFASPPPVIIPAQPGVSLPR